MQIMVDGLSVHYVAEGNGAPVLLLHGWGANVDSFHDIRQELSSSFLVISLDFPGFGQSDMPPEPWSVSDYVVFTEHFLHAIGVSDPIVLAHSFGGRVIIRMVGEGRIHPPKIVLLDAAGIRPKKTLRTKLRLAAFKTAKGILTLPLLKKPCAPLLDQVRAYFGSADYNNAPEVLRQTLVKVVNEDLRDFLPKISCPTLLIYGENDTATPVRDAQIMESLLQDAGLCVIKGAGHFSFLDRPYEVHAILHSFLGGK